MNPLNLQLTQDVPMGKFHDFSVFNGGWSYSKNSIKKTFEALPYQPNINVVEFGAGDSTIKLLKILTDKYYEVTYDCYETNVEFAQPNPKINYIIYNESSLPSLQLEQKIYDLVLIDGPTGVNRKFWYSKLINNVKQNTIILIDDWNHYTEFETALTKDLGSIWNYTILENVVEKDPNSAPHLGFKSWKLIKIIDKKIKNFRQ